MTAPQAVRAAADHQRHRSSRWNPLQRRPGRRNSAGKGRQATPVVNSRQRGVYAVQ